MRIVFGVSGVVEMLQVREEVYRIRSSIIVAVIPFQRRFCASVRPAKAFRPGLRDLSLCGCGPHSIRASRPETLGIRRLKYFQIGCIGAAAIRGNDDLWLATRTLSVTRGSRAAGNISRPRGFSRNVPVISK